MKSLPQFVAAATLAVVFSGLYSMANATDTSEAVKLCEKNPACVKAETTDSIAFTVTGPKGGKSVVICPLPEGRCTAARVEGDAVRRRIVTSILNTDG